jgi:adenosylhomocysteine nucleosidase
MLAFIVGLQAEARLLPGPVFIGGGGAEGAARATAQALQAGATSLISFGLAGGLDPALPPGTLIIPRRVLWRDRAYDTDDMLNERLGGVTHESLLAGERVAVLAAEKRALHLATGAAAIDLESGAVARSGLRFAVLRAVCDPAARDLPQAALAALDSAGLIGLGRVLASVAREPRQIASLLALGRDAALARRSLARRISARLAAPA